MTLSATFYEVLGVGPKATEDALRKAYRRLAQKHHPDVSSDPRAHDNMAHINEAFQTLVDPTRRMEYDAMLAGGGVEAAPRPDHHQPAQPVVVKLLRRLRAHRTPVYAVTFNPDNGQVISSGFDNEVLWWDEQLAVPIQKVRLEHGTVSTIQAFSGDRLVAAGAGESQISFYSVTGQKLNTWRASQEEWVSCVSVSPDGRYVASGSMLQTFMVTDTENGSCIYRRSDHVGAVTAVAWSKDGTLIASGGADCVVKLWHARSGALLHTIRQVRSTVTSIAFSPDNRYIAIAGVDLSIRIFSLSDGLLVKMLFGHTKPIESMEFHPNGWLLASASRDGTVGLWNSAKGIGNVRLEMSSRPISCVAFSADGTRLAASSQDKTVRLWEVAAKESA